MMMTPPEHIQTNPSVSGINGMKDESKHYDASFIIHLLTSSTTSYAPPTIAKPNGHNADDHDFVAMLDQQQITVQNMQKRKGDTTILGKHLL